MSVKVINMNIDNVVTFTAKDLGMSHTMTVIGGFLCNLDGTCPLKDLNLMLSDMLGIASEIVKEQPNPDNRAEVKEILEWREEILELKSKTKNKDSDPGVCFCGKCGLEKAPKPEVADDGDVLEKFLKMVDPLLYDLLKSKITARPGPDFEEFLTDLMEKGHIKQAKQKAMITKTNDDQISKFLEKLFG